MQHLFTVLFSAVVASLVVFFGPSVLGDNRPSKSNANESVFKYSARCPGVDVVKEALAGNTVITPWTIAHPALGQRNNINSVAWFDASARVDFSAPDLDAPAELVVGCSYVGSPNNNQVRLVVKRQFASAEATIAVLRSFSNNINWNDDSDPSYDDYKATCDQSRALCNFSM